MRGMWPVFVAVGILAALAIGASEASLAQEASARRQVDGLCSAYQVGGSVTDMWAAARSARLAIFTVTERADAAGQSLPSRLRMTKRGGFGEFACEVEYRSGVILAKRTDHRP